MASVQPLSGIILALGFLFWLYLVGTTTDDFLAPTLERLSNYLKLTPQVSGVTLLALGNGAPDVFTSFASFTGGGTGALGVGDVIGAGLFITTCVLAGVTLIAGEFQTKKGPFLRDCGFTFASVVLLFFVFSDRTVHLYEGLAFFLLYIAYILVVAFGKKLGVTKDEEDEEDQEKPLVKSVNSTAGGRPASKMAIVVESNSGGLHVPPAGTRSRAQSSGDMMVDYMLASTHQKAQRSISKSMNVMFRSEDDAHHMVYRGQDHPHYGKRSKASKASKASKHSKVSSRISKHSHVELPDTEPRAKEITIEQPVADRHKLESIPQETQPLRPPPLARRLSQRNLSERTPREKVSWVFEKIIQFLEGPFVVFRILTIPMFLSHDLEAEEEKEPEEADEEEEEDENKLMTENKTCLCLALLFGPLMFTFVAGSSTWGFVCVIFICATLSLFMFRSILSLPQSSEGVIHYTRWQQFILLATALSVSILWVYLFANELVGCLGTLGTAMGLSENTIGLTFLAAGNSVQDLIADVIVAKKGKPLMAIGGVFGGPGFNIMIGLGMGFTYATISSTFNFDFEPTVPVGFFFFGGWLLACMIYLSLNQYWFTKKMGVFGLGLYVVFVVVALLAEGSVIPGWNPQDYF